MADPTWLLCWPTHLLTIAVNEWSPVAVATAVEPSERLGHWPVGPMARWQQARLGLKHPLNREAAVERPEATQSLVLTRPDPISVLTVVGSVVSGCGWIMP